MKIKINLTNSLPERNGTSDNFVMMIEDAQSGDAVGYIWYLYEFHDGVKQVYLSDFMIYEKERRKGYATAALTAMERNALKDDCSQSILFVWKHNPIGVNLYTKCHWCELIEILDRIKKGAIFHDRKSNFPGF